MAGARRSTDVQTADGDKREDRLKRGRAPEDEPGRNEPPSREAIGGVHDRPLDPSPQLHEGEKAFAWQPLTLDAQASARIPTGPPFQVEASAPGRLPRTSEWIRKRGPMDFVLLPGREVSGSVARYRYSDPWAAWPEQGPDPRVPERVAFGGAIVLLIPEGEPAPPRPVGQRFPPPSPKLPENLTAEILDEFLSGMRDVQDIAPLRATATNADGEFHFDGVDPYQDFRIVAGGSGWISLRRGTKIWAGRSEPVRCSLFALPLYAAFVRIATPGAHAASDSAERRFPALDVWNLAPFREDRTLEVPISFAEFLVAGGTRANWRANANAWPIAVQPIGYFGGPRMTGSRLSMGKAGFDPLEIPIEIKRVDQGCATLEFALTPEVDRFKPLWLEARDGRALPLLAQVQRKAATSPNSATIRSPPTAH